MKRIIKLTESQMKKIIERVINEQSPNPDFKGGTAPNPFVKKTEKPTSGKQQSPNPKI